MSDTPNAIRERNRALRAKDPRPNILFIFTDQQTLSAMSCSGNPHVHTPHLDALARRGMRFTQSYCTAPICGPSRSSMITSRMPHETGVDFNGATPDPSTPNLGHIFRKAGYHTTWSGKWHLPQSYIRKGEEMPGFDNIPISDDVSSIALALGDKTDFLFADDAKFHLRWHAGLSPKPWLYTVSLHNPHDICHYPMQPRPPYTNTETLPPLPPNHAIAPDEAQLISRRRDNSRYGQEVSHTTDWNETDWRQYLQTYYHMVQSADRAVGMVLDSLRKGGWEDNTLILFTSDHGEGVAAHKWLTKLSLYEESVAVPLILSYPGHIPEDTVNDTHLASALDILPTLCDYAGITDLPLHHGRSLRPVIEDPSSPGSPYVACELATDPSHPELAGRMIRTPRYKYCAYSWGAHAEQLFDMQDDPGEMHNLATDPDHHDTLLRHRSFLQEWIGKTNDPFSLLSEVSTPA